jgi:hypothetical protein
MYDIYLNFIYSYRVIIDHSCVSVNIAVSCLACTTTQQKLGPLPAPKTSGFC